MITKATVLLRAAALNEEMRETGARMGELTVALLRGPMGSASRRAAIEEELGRLWQQRANQLEEAARLMLEVSAARKLLPQLAHGKPIDEMRAEAWALQTASQAAAFGWA